MFWPLQVHCSEDKLGCYITFLEIFKFFNPTALPQLYSCLLCPLNDSGIWIPVFISVAGIWILISVTGIWILISVTGIWILISVTGIWILISVTGIWILIFVTAIWILISVTGIWILISGTGIWILVSVTGIWILISVTGIWILISVTGTWICSMLFLMTFSRTGEFEMFWIVSVNMDWYVRKHVTNTFFITWAHSIFYQRKSMTT